MKWAIDGDDIALPKHLLKVCYTATADFLLLFWGKGLVVVVEKLLAVEGLEAAKNTLANASDGDSSDHLALEVKLVFGRLCNIPPSLLDHLVGRDEIPNEDQDGHDDVLGYGHDVRTSNLGDGDAAIGLVGGIQVDMIRANAGGDGKLELLGLG